MAGSPRLDRRGFCAAATTVAVAGCLGGGDTEASPDEVAEDGNASPDLTAYPTELREQLVAVREATARYEEIGVALDDGFVISGPYVPGMGWHLVHEGRAQAAAEAGFALEEPQVLVYPETDDGPTLGAAEWAAPANAVDGDPDLFADEAADAEERWHPLEAAEAVLADGDGVATPPPEIPRDAWLTDENWIQNRPSEDLSAGDTVVADFDGDGEDEERVVDVAAPHPALTTLHAWVHLENPDGVFAPTNPRFGGDGADHHGGGHG